MTRSSFLVGLVLLASPLHAQDWPFYGGGLSGARYSAASEITPANVARLQLAWVYHTGDLHANRGRFEANPILVDGALYFSTPLGTVISLDPATGAERWRSDQHVDLTGDYGDFASRGVSTWLDGSAPPDATCRRMIYFATVEARLIALDAANGARCEAFGEHGVVDLAQGLRHQPSWHGEYGVTSPPIVVNGLVITGSAVSDNQRTDAPEGVVRAWDARTGALRWRWDPISAPAVGAANAWSVFAADTALGLVYVPVGSASPDFFGGARLGDDRYANSIVALRVATGEVAWAFQVVHHDIWDYDIPAQPALFTWHHGARSAPAVAVATKMGHLFILDRRTGRPLVPIEERPVPASDVPGEQAWPTQPFPPPAYRLVPESLDQAFGRSPADQQFCADWLGRLRHEGIFTPQSVRGTLNYPGHIGGMNWSGVAVDEARGLLIAPLNNLPMVVTLIPRDSVMAMRMAHPGAEISRQAGTPFAMMRETMLTAGQVPCNAPPWGTLTAVDLAHDSVRWRVPLGDAPGTIGLGGALVTRSGLIFIASTIDGHLRAFDEETGRLLWMVALPAGGQALPMTYSIGGRQYVVQVAGGHDRLPVRMGDYVLAFALPDPRVPAPDTTTAAMPGDYKGELRVGGARVGFSVRLSPSGDSLAASATGTDSVSVSGAAQVAGKGHAIRLDIPFDYAAKHCAGVVHATLNAWNAGTLLEGLAEVTGSCGGGPPEHGTLTLRRTS